MQYYELATLTTPVGYQRGEKLAKTLAGVTSSLAEPGAGGVLLGSWLSEFSPQNKILVLRGFDSRDALLDERERMLRSANPFGGGDLVSISMESFTQFPDLPPIRPADFGPVYEFRTYNLKIGGLIPTLEAWHKAIPARAALSPIVTVMYALDGPPRFTHVWAYKSFEHRLAVRAEAVETGVWPAKGAPEWLMTEMKSECYLPTAISPLT
jgi:hypothetical protein